MTRSMSSSCPGDQICKQDYADFLRFHKEKGAEFSVAVMEVDWKEASRFGLMVADENDKITEFQEKPPVPKSNLASMGIYIFNWDVLKKYLEEDEADPNSKNDFGMNIIPALLRDGRKMYAYHFNGYWRDVGTIDSCGKPTWRSWTLRTPASTSSTRSGRSTAATRAARPEDRPRAVVQDSLVTEGCQIYGCVKHSGAERRHRRGRGRNGRGCRPDGWRRGQGRRSGQALHPR